MYQAELSLASRNLWNNYHSSSHSTYLPPASLMFRLEMKLTHPKTPSTLEHNNELTVSATQNDLSGLADLSLLFAFYRRRYQEGWT